MTKFLKTGFAFALATVLTLGFIAATEPANARPVLGPSTDCPSYTCPTNLSGWSHDGYCTTDYGHGCVEQCSVWKNSSGTRCKNVNNCAWW